MYNVKTVAGTVLVVPWQHYLYISRTAKDIVLLVSQ